METASILKIQIGNITLRGSSEWIAVAAISHRSKKGTVG